MPTTQPATPHRKIFAATLLLLLTFLGASLWHTWHQPYPIHWDDGTYVMAVYRWMDRIQVEGWRQGLASGFRDVLPNHMPPLIFVSALPGVAWKGTSLAIHLFQVPWLALTLLLAFLLGRRAAGALGGLFCVFWVGSNLQVFYWSTKVMGEPPFFALLLATMLALSYVKKPPRLAPSLGLGGLLGLGMLSKQWYPILCSGPILWTLQGWLRSQAQAKTGYRPLLRALAGIALGGLLVCGPWYASHLPHVLAYLGMEHFAPHSLGDSFHPRLIWTYASFWPGAYGCPFVIAIAVACIAWAGRFRERRNAGTDSGDACGETCRHLLALLLAGVCVGLFVLLYIRYSNMRFSSSTSLLLSAWIGILFAHAYKRGPTWIQGFLLLLMSAQTLVWSHAILGWPPESSLLRHAPAMQPVSAGFAGEISDTLAREWENQDRQTLWMSGLSSSFNYPLITVLLMEKGVNARTDFLYEWDQDDMDAALARVRPGQWLLVYADDTVWPAPALLTRRWDKAIMEALPNRPSEWRICAHVEDAQNPLRPRATLFQRIPRPSQEPSP